MIHYDVFSHINWGIVVENKPMGYIGDEILPSYITYIGIIS